MAWAASHWGLTSTGQACGSEVLSASTLGVMLSVSTLGAWVASEQGRIENTAEPYL